MAKPGSGAALRYRIRVRIQTKRTQNTAHVSSILMLQLYRGAESRVQPQGGGGGEACHQPEELGPLLGLRLSQRCQAHPPLPCRLASMLNSPHEIPSPANIQVFESNDMFPFWVVLQTWNVYPGSRVPDQNFSIPDPGSRVKNILDPGSGFA
jgi:hypothetical protein